LWKTLAEDFPNHRVLNRGFGGSQLSDLAHFADRLVLAYEPRFIVVYSGGNDLNAGKTAEQVFESFRELVGRIRSHQPETPIAYLSIAGNPKRWAQVAEVIRANALIEVFTKQNERLLFIDVFHPMLGLDGRPKPEIFAADRLHMNPAGYALWKQTVLPYLPKADLPQDGNK
jgi:lysophospholipase L1-like esterase